MTEACHVRLRNTSRKCNATESLRNVGKKSLVSFLFLFLLSDMVFQQKNIFLKISYLVSVKSVIKCIRLRVVHVYKGNGNVRTLTTKLLYM